MLYLCAFTLFAQSHVWTLSGCLCVVCVPSLLQKQYIASIRDRESGVGQFESEEVKPCSSLVLPSGRIAVAAGVSPIEKQL